jgi:hypothetical protein
MIRHYWDEKQLLFLKKHAKGKPFKELTGLFNAAFSLNLTPSQVKSGCGYHGIKTGMRGKGVRERILPVGSERVLDRRCGYTHVKASMEDRRGAKGGCRGTWILKHHLIWESVNGPKPAHHLIIFADQNKHNVAIENLLLVSKREYFYMIKNGLLTNNTELTRINHAFAKHRLAIVDAVDRLTGNAGHKKHYTANDAYRRYKGRHANNTGAGLNVRRGG